MPPSEEEVEAAARAIHQDDCIRAVIDYQREGIPVPEKWADPWAPWGTRQRQRLEHYARSALLAAEKVRAAASPPSDKVAEATRYAERLAAVLVAKHYPENTRWKPLSGDLVGLLTQIDNATAGLARSASQADGWRPIESAPKDGTGIVAFVPGFGMGAMVLFWLDGYWREPANHLGLKVPPTHWRPLPPPPEGSP